MGILIHKRLRPKRRIVGTVVKIGTKENFSLLHGGKVNPILIGRRTDELFNDCGYLSIKWPKRYCGDENVNKHRWQMKMDIRNGFRFARRSELTFDDIKSVNTK